MDKGVILDFFHPIDFAVLLENFLKLFFCYRSRQISDVQNFHLRHGLIIGLFLRVSPINNNITAPYLDSTSFQSAFGKTSRFVGFIFKEAKSTILLFVIRRTVDNNLSETSCDFSELLLDFIFAFRLGDIAYE
jgi:hypothetical protein